MDSHDSLPKLNGSADLDFSERYLDAACKATMSANPDFKCASPPVMVLTRSMSKVKSSSTSNVPSRAGANCKFSFHKDKIVMPIKVVFKASQNKNRGQPRY